MEKTGDESPFTPLIYLIHLREGLPNLKNLMHFCKKLVKLSKDINAVCKAHQLTGETALDFAIEKFGENDEIVTYLIENGGKQENIHIN